MGLLTEDVATKVDLPALSATGFSLKPASKQRGRTTGTTVSRGEIPSAAGTEPTPAKGPDYAIESERLDRGARHVAGVDEAGRGPLAGPVVAAAVILDLASLPKGLDDSKKLTAAERERLFDEIVAGAAFCVASASAAEIDRLNIRQATLLAMTRALAGLERQPCHAIVDGRDVPALWASRGTAVISGDARSLSIAAASIVAKVTRDRMMQRLCQAFPAYGFSRHMGYGTAEHRLALDRHGPCPFHRMTFSPIRQGVLDLG
ncbi:MULTISPECIES: ribonuclease HII [unclassified Aureimonas]|uniref:ribonuclease HII n=1 Tax=unclassified Aureimonas TaxID=2615206 RepID=UPI0009EA577A|nr:MULTISPECIES: ribonuclease HII [unclassified Aureimonas]